MAQRRTGQTGTAAALVGAAIFWAHAAVAQDAPTVETLVLEDVEQTSAQVTRMSFDSLVPLTQSAPSSDFILVLVGASSVLSAASFVTGAPILPLPGQ